MSNFLLGMIYNERARCVYKILLNTYSDEDIELAKVIYKESTPYGGSKQFCEETGMSPKHFKAFRKKMRVLYKTTLSQEQLPVDISEDKLLLLIGGDSFG